MLPLKPPARATDAVPVTLTTAANAAIPSSPIVAGLISTSRPAYFDWQYDNKCNVTM
jgi:hypothetical protein